MRNILKLLCNNNSEDKKNIELIRNSKFFDKEYYLQEKPNVKGDPCRDYYYFGWKEGKSPNLNFSNDFYLENYKDVRDSGMNPLLHYLKFGASENRIISNDIGQTFKKIYKLFYNSSYFYKLFYSSLNSFKVNLFIDNIDNNVLIYKDLFKYLSSYCNSNKFVLRIIYNNADFDNFNKLCLPDDVQFINLKDYNFLDVSLNDIYVCTSWKNARALLNTYNFQNNLYFYINEYDIYNEEEYFQISKIINHKKTTVLVDDESILNKIYDYKINYNYNNIRNDSYKNIYCIFDNQFIEGIELLNNLSLNDYFNNSYVFSLVCDNNNKFHLDSKEKIFIKENIKNDVDLIINLSNKKVKDNIPVISYSIIKKKSKISSYININKDKSLSLCSDKIITNDILVDVTSFKKLFSKIVEKR